MATSFENLPGTLGLPPIALMLSRFGRGELESFVAAAIDYLDIIDGDPDFEDTDIEDGDPLDLGEEQAETGAEVLATVPLYGVDQTSGPINEAEAVRAHRIAQYRQGRVA